MWWTWLYTSGLTPSLRDARRAEIASDLWESNQTDPQTPGRVIVFRLLAGVGDDIRWRSDVMSIHARAQLVIAAVLTVMAVVTVSLTLRQAVVLPNPPTAPSIASASADADIARPLPPPPPPPPPSSPRAQRSPRPQ